MNMKDKLLIDQYNKFPYPRPIKNIDKEIINKGKIPIADPNFSWHLLWPEIKYSNKNLKILIAGCGTHQAAIIARLNPQNFIIGVDISKNSIDHEKKLKELHNLNNLELINNDFRELKFDYKFDYIISTGVIHHLKEPDTALNFFEKNISDKGVIYLMVYGSKKRFALNEIVKVYKKLQFTQTEKSIIQSKNLIGNLDENHPAKEFTYKSTDMQSKEGIVDLLLNYQEKHYDIDELTNMIENEKLFIKNTIDGSISSISKFFLDDYSMISKIRKLDYKDKLKIGQTLNWNDAKIVLILNKVQNKKHSIILNKINLRKCFFYHNRSILIEIAKNYLIINEKKTSKKYKIKINDKIVIDWKLILSGKSDLNSIITSNDKNLEKEIYDLFEILVENRFIDISFYKIENYFNYLPKTEL